jgi:hypothetical protein
MKDSFSRLGEVTMKSKAQVSVYIALGIVLLLLFFLLTHQKPATLEEDTYLNPGTAEDYVKSCLYHSALDAYIKIGYFGGAVTAPHPDYIKTDFNYPDYNLPDIDTITDRAKYFILAKYDMCIDEINSKGMGFNISKKTPQISITYTDQINIRLDDAGVIYLGNSGKVLKNIAVNLKIRFKEIHQLAQYIINYKTMNPDREPSFMNYDIKNIKIKVLWSNQSTYVISDNSLNQSYLFIMPA